MFKSTFVLLVLVFISFFTSCKPDTRADVYQASAFSDYPMQAIIEIPAGTSHKIEFNAETQVFENDQIDGKDRVIDFLPYPGNYGFIPSTLMDAERGGDGDALDVLVIAEQLATGTKVAIIPIAALSLKDNGELDTKVIAIPADTSLQIIKAQDFRRFSMEYSAAKNIIEQWFLNYKGLGQVELLGWKNEQVALAEIKKWRLPAAIEVKPVE
ncbi:MAG: inorganic diphosphatase [Saprospiraceae bacterium]